MQVMPHAKSARFWDKFRLIQKHTDPRKIDPQSWAIDEVIGEYLNRVDATNPDVEPLTDEEIEELPGAFWDRVWNKKKKHRRRRRIALTRFPHETGRPVVDLPEPSKSAIDHARNNPDESLDRTSAVAAVKAQVSRREWQLLWAHAYGRTFAELSIDWGEAIGTLKSRLARCRKRLRDG
jgi:hypothetical protein